MNKYADVPKRSHGPKIKTEAPEQTANTIPRKTTPAATKGTTPYKTVSNAPQATSMRIIQDMQQELINLSNVVSADIKIETGPQAGQTSGRNAFADFIATHYIRHSDVKAAEFDPDPKVTEISKKAPAGPSKMINLMNTMGRIGSKTSEGSPDGIWGPKTNQALHNAYAFGYAMIQMVKSFPEVKATYTDKELTDFKTKIPEKDTDYNITQKLDAAKKIIVHLTGIRQLYNEVKQDVLNNPEYKSYIEGDKPVQTYKKPTFPTLAANTIKSMQEQFNNKLLVNYTDATGNQIAVPIKIEDLLNKASLEKWQKQNAPTLPLVNILNSLRNYIGMQTGTKTIKVDQSGQHIPGMGTV